MNLRHALLSTCVAAGLALGFTAAPAAASVLFSVTSGSFTIGSGYGTGNNQLDVTFTNLVTPQSFSLDVGQTQSFLFGRATLNETDISQSETDNLGVKANITFASPLSATVVDVAVTGAFVGPVNGIFENFFTDYYIDFSPVTVSFGNGGSFVLDVGDMFFNRTGSITNGVNVTLASVPVPEPVSMALFGTGLLGLGLIARRKQTTTSGTGSALRAA